MKCNSFQIVKICLMIKIKFIAGNFPLNTFMWGKDPDPDPPLWQTVPDADPGGPKNI